MVVPGTGGSETRTYFHQDKMGSVVAMSSDTGAPMEGPYTYDVFGNGAPLTGVPYKFTGQRLDPETGLYYYRARYYSAALGRFLQTDPVGYKDDMDLYTYVGNDPLDHTDPTGKATTCTAGPDGTQQCTMTSDTFNAAKSNGQTSVPSPQVKAAAEAGKSQVAVHPGPNEKLGFIVTGPDGKPVVQSASDTKTGSTSTGSTATATVPSGALAVIHGHIDTGPDRSNGMVDDPKSNRGYGDTQPLKAGLPNATVSHGDVGWHEIVNGQLVYTFPGGAMTTGQQDQMQQNLNNEQPLFQVP